MSGDVERRDGDDGGAKTTGGDMHSEWGTTFAFVHWREATNRWGGCTHE